MYDLYTWSTPNGRKVSIMLEELGVPYDAHAIDIGQNMQFDPEFLTISPNNKIPAIVDREAGLSLMESGAILIYLAEKHGQFLGEGTTRLRVLEWLMWQMGGLGPMAGQAHHFLKYNRGKSAYAEERYGQETQRLYGVLNKRLEGSAHVGGTEYSIADMAIWPWVSRFEWQQIDLASFPAVCTWYERIAARPAVARGYHVPVPQPSIPMP
ncbi:MAG: glutathione S-transferase N-terminal domain-containing protein [Pseudomonadota bacterium]